MITQNKENINGNNLNKLVSDEIVDKRSRIGIIF